MTWKSEKLSGTELFEREQVKQKRRSKHSKPKSCDHEIYSSEWEDEINFNLLFVAFWDFASDEKEQRKATHML